MNASEKRTIEETLRALDDAVAAVEVVLSGEERAALEEPYTRRGASF